MQLSGQTVAQFVHPVQASLFSSLGKWYPFALTCSAMTITLVGQATIHSSHPLQDSVSTTIAPFTFAILFIFNFKFPPNLQIINCNSEILEQKN